MKSEAGFTLISVLVAMVLLSNLLMLLSLAAAPQEVAAWTVTPSAGEGH